MNRRRFPVLRDKKSYIQKIIATNPIAYWPFNEVSGTTAINYGTIGSSANGVYTGPTLNNYPAPGGGKCPNFDGLGMDDRVNIYSAALNSNLNKNLFSISIWAKMVDASIWTNGQSHSIIRLYIDVNNEINFVKHSANPLYLYIKSGGGIKFSIISTTTIDWYHICMTFDKASDELKFYLNAEQQGATQTGLGNFTGNLDSAACMIGAQGTGGTLPFNGYFAHPTIHNKVLTDAEILNIYNV
jgi:hypothetical protein